MASPPQALQSLAGMSVTFEPVEPQSSPPFIVHVVQPYKCGSVACVFSATITMRDGQVRPFVLKLGATDQAENTLQREYAAAATAAASLQTLGDGDNTPFFAETVAAGLFRVNNATVPGLLLNQYDGDAVAYVRNCVGDQCGCRRDANFRLFHAAHRAAEDLAEFHAAGLLHADFKFDNVLVQRRRRTEEGDAYECDERDSLLRSEDPVRVVLADCSLCQLIGQDNPLHTTAGSPFTRSVLVAPREEWSAVVPSLVTFLTSHLRDAPPDAQTLYRDSLERANFEDFSRAFLGSHGADRLDSPTQALLLTALAQSPLADLEGLLYDTVAMYRWNTAHDEGKPDVTRALYLVPAFVGPADGDNTENDVTNALLWWERWTWYLAFQDTAEPAILADLPRELVKALRTVYAKLRRTGQELAEMMAAPPTRAQVRTVAHAAALLRQIDQEGAGAAVRTLTRLNAQPRLLNVLAQGAGVAAEAVGQALLVLRNMVFRDMNKNSDVHDTVALLLGQLWKSGFATKRRLRAREDVIDPFLATGRLFTERLQLQIHGF